MDRLKGKRIISIYRNYYNHGVYYTSFYWSSDPGFRVDEKADMKVLLLFITSYLCEVGFSALINIKTKYRNRLDISNSLRLKVTKIDVDAKAVMEKNRKQLHPSHSH